MAKAKEFTVTIEDKPGALGRCFLALAERGVNVLAFQSYVEEGESLARFVAAQPDSKFTPAGVLKFSLKEKQPEQVLMCLKSLLVQLAGEPAAVATTSRDTV